MRRCVVQDSSIPTWQQRELAQLQDEVALLKRLLKAIKPLDKAHADTHGHEIGTPMPHETMRPKANHAALRGNPQLCLRA